DGEEHTITGDAMRNPKARALFAAYLAELSLRDLPWNVIPADLLAGRALLAADAETRLAVLRSAIHHSPRSVQKWPIHHVLLAQLVRRSLPYTLDDIRLITQVLGAGALYYPPIQALLRALARPLADPALLAAVRPDLESLREKASATWYESANK